MKYLIIGMLLLSGCASTQMSDYEQGCYDALDKWFKRDRSTYIENLKNNTCKDLTERRNMEEKLKDKRNSVPVPRGVVR